MFIKSWEVDTWWWNFESHASKNTRSYKVFRSYVTLLIVRFCVALTAQLIWGSVNFCFGAVELSSVLYRWWALCGRLSMGRMSRMLLTFNGNRLEFAHRFRLFLVGIFHELFSVFLGFTLSRAQKDAWRFKWWGIYKILRLSSVRIIFAPIGNGKSPISFERLKIDYVSHVATNCRRGHNTWLWVLKDLPNRC